MWSHGSKPNRTSACRNDVVPVRPNPAPMTRRFGDGAFVGTVDGVLVSVMVCDNTSFPAGDPQVSPLPPFFLMRLPAILACRSIVRTHSVCRRQRITGRKPQHERMYLFLTPGWNRRPAGAPHAPNNPLGAIALQRRCNIRGVDCSPAAPQPTMATLRRLSAWPPPPPAARARILRRSPRRRAPSHITAREPRLGTADSRAAEKCAEIGATNRSGGTFRAIGNNDESSLTPRRIWAHLGTKAVSSRIRAAFSVGGARRADAAGTQGARAVVAAAAALTKPTAGGGP